MEIFPISGSRHDLRACRKIPFNRVPNVRPTPRERACADGAVFPYSTGRLSLRKCVSDSTRPTKHSTRQLWPSVLLSRGGKDTLRTRSRPTMRSLHHKLKQHHQRLSITLQSLRFLPICRKRKDSSTNGPKCSWRLHVSNMGRYWSTRRI
jgi:hypothetical protein